MTPVERAELWRQRVETHQGSGLTLREFSEREGIAYYGLRFWRRKLAGGSIATSSPSRLVPLKVAPACSGWGQAVPATSSMEVRLKGDRRILVNGDFDEASLGRLIGVLEQLPC